MVMQWKRQSRCKNIAEERNSENGAAALAKPDCLMPEARLSGRSLKQTPTSDYPVHAAGLCGGTG